MATTPRGSSSLAAAAAGTRDDLVQLYNVQLADGTSLNDGELWMQGGTIVDPQRRFWAREGAAADRRVDCGGRILAPGFIDTQLYAAAGVVFDELGADAPDGDAAASKALAAVAERLPSYGVTSYCPALRSTSPAAYRRLLLRLRPWQPRRGAALVGCHLDGPFICETPPPDGPHCVTPSLASGRAALLETYGDDLARSAALLTLAPELAGAADAIGALREMGVRVGLGRSGATLAQCVDAVAAGASFVTQLFSRMPPFHHRDPGPVGLLVETPPGAARVHYTLDMRTTISAHTANLATSAHPHGATLVTAAERGDDADLSACVRRLWEARGKGDPCAALRAASAAPAALLGLDAKGRLTPGADADLVLLAPDDLSVRACFVGGELAWAHPEERGAENGGRH